MIWNSTLAIIVFDVLVLGLSCFAAWIFNRQLISLKERRYGAGSKLTLAGIAIIAIFHLADLITIFVFPSFILREQTIVASTYLHTNIGWISNLVGICLIGCGWLLINRTIISLFDALQISRKDTKRELDRHQRLESSLNEHAIVSIADKSGKIIHVNDMFCDISGYTRNELLGQNYRMVNSGYHPKAFFEEMWKTITSGKPWNGQVKNRAKDGTFYWVQSSIMPILSLDGKKRQYLSIRTDITVQKENNDRFKTTIENFPGGIAIFDKNLALVFANERYYELTALPSAIHPVGTPLEDILRHNAASGLFGEAEEEEIVRREISAFKTIAENPGKALPKFETCKIEDRILEATLYNLPDSSVAITYMDVTEAKASQALIQQSRDRLKIVFDNFPGGISFIDTDLTMAAMNSLFYEFTGVPKDEFPVGSKYEDIIRYLAKQGWYGDSEVDEIVQQRLGRIRRFEPEEIERTIPDGRTLEMRTVPLLGGGSVRTYLDVTERKRAEEAHQEHEQILQDRVTQLEKAHRQLEEQGEDLVCLTRYLKDANNKAETANRSKSEFLAAMSHELRTSLNAIMGFSEILQNQTFGPVGNPKYLEYVKDIYESGEHLLELINDILDLTKIEAGESDLTEETIDIAKVVKSCLTLVQERAHKADLTLISEFEDDLAPLYADKRKLKQILVNLLTNAIKFTPSGGKVTIKIWYRAASGYVFQIIDTGIGIALEDIPYALAPFKQIDGDLARKYEGTGLGLPLTKSLVELHGGSFDLQSQVGVGTAVTVRFPAERIVSETATTPHLRSVPTNKATQV